ncbi:alpha/beta fold hydrolase, partial [Halorhodospira neutriphila]
MLSAGDPGQPALVLLHGFMGDAAEWGPVAERLSGRHYCLAPTLPGHDGRPPAAEDFAGLAEALWQRLAPQLPERFALAGYSLGGRLALALAQRCPQRLTGLILEGAHPGLRDAAEREQRRAHDEAWAARLEQEPRAQALAAWYRQPVFASLSEAQRRALV